MTGRSARLIKRYQRVARRGVKAEVAVDANRWSMSVRSWVIEFQKRNRTEAMPAFDRLFRGSSQDTRAESFRATSFDREGRG